MLTVSDIARQERETEATYTDLAVKAQRRGDDELALHYTRLAMIAGTMAARAELAIEMEKEKRHA